MKVWGSGSRPSQKGKSKWTELTTTQPKPEAALTTVYLLFYALEDQWQQLMRISEPQLQWHWKEQWELRLKRPLWPPTHSWGLKGLGRNQTRSLKSFVVLRSPVSVGRDCLHEEHLKHQTVNIFSSLGIITIHQRIIRDWFMNESDCRPNIIYELGQTWIFHAGQTKRAYDFLSWSFMRSWP